MMNLTINLGFLKYTWSAYGRSLILGHLNSIGIKAQQKRVKESLVRVDPNGCHSDGH